MARHKDKPGDSLPNVKKSRNAEATGGESATMPEYGSVYAGEVLQRQSDGTYSVQLEDPAMELHKVQLAFPVMGGLLGLQVRCNLPQHTRVQVVFGQPSFIIAVMQDNSTDWLNASSRSLIHGGDLNSEMGVEGDNYGSQAEDLLEGEVELNNLFGVALEFLTTLMRMKAGDRAAVECHLINDMVRLISSQFRHISGMGEDLSFDHGRPTFERNWSSYRHEVLGLVDEKDKAAEMNGDEADREKLDEKRVTGLGRYRLREFIGFAGDFIHSFVSDPPESMVSLVKGGASSGAGKSWIHRNSDGSVIINSVADIRIERTCRIPVAVRCAHHESPEITKERAYDQLQADFLKLPDMINPVDPKNAYQAAYHIRSYARWLGRYHSFARMLQLPDEYDIPSEADSPAPDWNNGESDRSTKNPRVSYYDAYACITIMRDGSIVMHDGYGSSVMMSNGNIQLSAARHLDLEAAGDIRVVAGGSFFVKARRNIELSATIGGVIIHGYAWMKMLCEKGTTWLRSNLVAGETPTAKEDGPTPEVAGYEDSDNPGFAVLVESVGGATAIRSEKGLTLAVDGIPQNSDDHTFDIVVSTSGDLELYGERRSNLYSGSAVSIGSGGELAIAASTVITSASEILVGNQPENPSLILRYGKLWCQQIDGNTIRSNSFKGPDRRDPTSNSYRNYIDTLPTGTTVEAPTGASDEEQVSLAYSVQLASTTPALPWDGSSDGPVWSFPSAREYMWDSREVIAGAVPETITQQYLRLDNEDSEDQWGGNGYLVWDLRSVPTGSRTAKTAGFGGSEKQYQADDSGENLHAPSNTEPKNMSVPASSWRPKSKFSIRALRRESD